MHVTRKSEKRELPPGSFVYVGKEKPGHDVLIEAITYSENSVTEKIIDIHEIDVSIKEAGLVSWYNINGLHDVEIVKKTGELFGLHALTIEDILNTNQRPKVEIHDNYIYATIKMILFDEKKQTFSKEQVSIILQENSVITFQELPEDTFSGLRKRIIQGKGSIRKMGTDYLFYSLMDSVIDGYFSVIEKLDDKLEGIEEKLVNSVNIISDVHWLKKEILYIRRSTAPVVDMIKLLLREDTYLIEEKTHIYLRDTQDHCIQVHDSVELIRDILSGLIEVQLSTLSNKMNEVMKYLTVFASIFIPLTFVTGIYGMNFEYMPELKWRYGYFTLLGTLLLVTVSLIIFFRKKKWI